MPDSPLNPPDSPPKAPVIPEGLATKLGKWGALAALLLTLVQEAGVDLDLTSKETLRSSILLAVVTMAGRYLQAAAVFRDAPSPAQTDDASGEVDLLDAIVDAPLPAEGALEEAYPGEREPEPGFDVPSMPLGMQDPENQS